MLLRFEQTSLCATAVTSVCALRLFTLGGCSLSAIDDMVKRNGHVYHITM